MSDAAAALPLDRVSAWCVGNGIPLDPDARAELIAGGRSNLTYRVTDGAGHDYVVRRPPTGEVLPRAHDMGREHGILAALHGTDIPVPEVLGSCADLEVVGAPFYVMRHVDGVVLATDADAARLDESGHRRASEQLVDVLARIHALDVDEAGLGGLGRRADFLPRQLAGWHRQFHNATTREVPLVDAVHGRLVARTPEQRYTGLVHGDYRPGNVLLGPDGTLNAVLDWELCALGDTMADLGWLLSTWREPGEPELHPTPTGRAGFLTRDEVIQRYVRVSGHDVGDIGFYMSFALWRLACIYEGIYTRYRMGAMADDETDVEQQGRTVLVLAEAAHAML